MEKATKHKHIAEATQQIEEQHMRILSLNSQKNGCQIIWRPSWNIYKTMEKDIT